MIYRIAASFSHEIRSGFLSYRNSHTLRFRTKNAKLYLCFFNCFFRPERYVLVTRQPRLCSCLGCDSLKTRNEFAAAIWRKMPTIRALSGFAFYCTPSEQKNQIVSASMPLCATKCVYRYKSRTQFLHWALFLYVAKNAGAKPFFSTLLQVQLARDDSSYGLLRFLR